MIQANYYDTNEDLKEFFQYLIPWNEVVPVYEKDYEDAKTYKSTSNSKLEYAPNNLDEALAFYEEILRITGDISGNEVSQIAADIDKIGLHFEDGKVNHPKVMVDAIHKYHEAGLGPVAFKRKFGGLGVPNVMKTLISELMYRSDSSITIAVGSMGLASILEQCASEEMQSEWIPKIIDGRYTVTMGLSEPDFGSDLPNVSTKAVHEEDGYYLYGTKRYQTMACGINGGPGLTLTLARTGSPESGARGLSFFLVESSEYQIQGIEKKLGIKASATCETVFDRSKGYLVGKEGMGLVRYVMGMLNGARLSVSSQGVGIGTAALEEAKKYAKERIQFGKPIESIPAVSRMLSHMEREVAGMRCLMVEAGLSVDRYQWSLEENDTSEYNSKFWMKVANTLTPISKYYNSETCNQVVYEGLQVLGGAGFTEDYDLARLYRDARITNIYDGTTQIQINAAIGGVITGFGTNGTFRKYVELINSNCERKELAQKIMQGLEELVAAYKSNQDQFWKDQYSFELVQITARLVVGALLERAYTQSNSSLKATRKKWSEEYFQDSLVLLEGMKVRFCS